MPVTTKTPAEQIATLKTQIAGITLRENQARIKREQLQNRLEQIQFRNSIAGDAPEVSTEN